ncbi:MAG: hypothetical protein KC620_24330, partial [Myxococcales bacterium]|nr:hypothetical protein [Myxococcales bacterium]
MWALLLALGGPGCQRDPPELQAADGGEVSEASVPDAVVDAAPVPEIPVAPLELMRHMPRPPPPIGAAPGDAAAALRAVRPGAKPSL